MKLKFTQGVYVEVVGRTMNVGDVEVVENEVVAASLVEAGFAVEVIKVPSETKVTEPVVKEVKQKAVKRKVGDK